MDYRECAGAGIYNDLLVNARLLLLYAVHPLTLLPFVKPNLTLLCMLHIYRSDLGTGRGRLGDLRC